MGLTGHLVLLVTQFRDLSGIGYKYSKLQHKQASAKTAAAETLASFAADCDNVMASLQAVAVKSPRRL